MGRVAELVAEYDLRLEPLLSNIAGANRVPSVFREFGAAVRSLGHVESEIIDGLECLLALKDPLSGEDWRRVALWITAAGESRTVGLVKPLCKLLDVRDVYLQHEWIAEILGEIGSPDAIPSLRDACSFDIPSDGRSLAMRCLDALEGIGTPAAIDAVCSQLKSPWREVREYASQVLNPEEYE